MVGIVLGIIVGQSQKDYLLSIDIAYYGPNQKLKTKVCI